MRLFCKTNDAAGKQMTVVDVPVKGKRRERELLRRAGEADCE